MAKKKKKTLTPLQKEYQKQRKRLTNAKRILESQGFIDIDLPEKPKKITKASVSRLSKITSEILRKKGRYISTQGEIQKYSDKTKNEIKLDIKKKKSMQNMVFSSIDRFREIISSEIPNFRTFYKDRQAFHMDFTGHKNMILSLLDDRIANDGEEAVNSLLHQNWDTIQKCFEDIFQDSQQERVERSFVEIGNLLKGSALTKEDLTMISELSDV